MQKQTVYGSLARLFEYPGRDYVANARGCLEQMPREQAEATALLKTFCEAIQTLNTDELQELYTQTFDLNPVCTLEIGWHLYGEDYQRGEFLVKMRRELRARKIDESVELPDHLTYALALLEQLEPSEAAEFAGQYLLPALDKMHAGWGKNRNIFGMLLESTFILLKSQYPFEPLRHPANVPELRVLQ